MLEIIIFYLFADYEIIVVVSKLDNIFKKIMFVLGTRVLAIKNTKVIQYISCAVPTKLRLQILIISIIQEIIYKKKHLSLLHILQI